MDAAAQNQVISFLPFELLSTFDVDCRLQKETFKNLSVPSALTRKLPVDAFELSCAIPHERRLLDVFSFSATGILFLETLREAFTPEPMRGTLLA